MTLSSTISGARVPPYFLALVSHRYLPKKISAGATECKEVSIVGNEEDFVIEQCDAAVGAELGIAGEAGRWWTRIGPQRSAAQSVNREDLIWRGEVQHTIGGQWGGFEAEIVSGKDPLQFQIRDIGGSDLLKFAIAIGGEIAVVGEPVTRLRRAPRKFR